MMLVVGLGLVGVVLVIFYLFIYGFFKVNMFFGVGLVMYGIGDDMDMYYFGVLFKVMFMIFWIFVCGYFVIIGIFGIFGYFFKDYIIEVVFDKGVVFGVLVFIGVGIIVYYMICFMMLIFLGIKCWCVDVYLYEFLVVMMIFFIVLVILLIFVGVFMNNWIGDWLVLVMGVEVEYVGMWYMGVIGVVIFVVVIFGIVVGWLFNCYNVLNEEFEIYDLLFVVGCYDIYGDDINDVVVVKLGCWLVGGVVGFDWLVVDGLVNGVGFVIMVCF